MANISRTPGSELGAPIESRRADKGEIDPSVAGPENSGEESPMDLPQLGEFAPEAARASPLDDLAEAEREKAPRD